MIEFDSTDELIVFLEENLPERIKKKLLYNGKSYFSKVQNRQITPQRHDWEVIKDLKNLGFLHPISKNKIQYLTYDKYLLEWSKLEAFIKKNDDLPVDVKQYALLSINSACKMLEITRPTLYKILNEKKIPYVQVLSEKRIQLKDILDYIAENKKYIE